MHAKLKQISVWFAGCGRPGDAATSVEILRKCVYGETIYHDHSGDMVIRVGHKIPKVAGPLVDWLLEKGTGQLRSKDSVKVLPAIIDHFAEREEYAKLSVTLKYFARLVHTELSNQDDWSSGPWPYLEKLVEENVDDHTELSLLVEQFLTPLDGQCWNPRPLKKLFRQPRQFPNCEQCFHDLVDEGTLKGDDDQLKKILWTLRMIFGEPPKSFASMTTIEEAFASLFRFHNENMRSISEFNLLSEEQIEEHFDSMGWVKDKQKRAKWKLAFLNEALRVHKLDPRPQALRLFIRGLIGFDSDSNELVVNKLHELCQKPESKPEFNLVSKLMAKAFNEREPFRQLLFTSSAISAWPLEIQRKRSLPAVDVSDLRDELHGLLHYPWSRPIFGIDLVELLKGATEVCFKSLANSNKVLIDGKTLLVDPNYCEETLKRWPDELEARKLCWIYVVHELVHLAQNIGDYDNVQRLRATGAEESLKHLDLAADHATAKIISQVRTDWSIVSIKDLTGQSTANFPASRYHTDSARYRKASRLVSLRLDYLIRQEIGDQLPTQLEESYFFGDYGPAGGNFLSLSYGPPSTVFGLSELTTKETKVLMEAANNEHANQEGLRLVDEVLLKHIANTQS